MIGYQVTVDAMVSSRYMWGSVGLTLLACLTLTPTAEAAVHPYANEYFYSVGDAFIFRGGREGLFQSKSEVSGRPSNVSVSRGCLPVSAVSISSRRGLLQDSLPPRRERTSKLK